MSDMLLYAAVGASALSVILLVVVLLRGGGSTTLEAGRIAADLRSLSGGQDRALRALFEELRSSRREGAEASQAQRAELSRSMKDLGDTMLRTLENITSLQKEQLGAFSTSIAELTRTSEGKLEYLRETVDKSLKLFRDESTRGIDQVQTGMAQSAKLVREEMGGYLKNMNDSMLQTQHAIADLQTDQLGAFGERVGELVASTERKAEELRAALEQKLARIQEESAGRLEEIRLTVDEKLEGTLEKRLGESFRKVTERLEQVHKGLGEMRALASDVGDLKKVINHVKTRGTWGEVQLGRLIEDVLAPDQFARNVATRPGSEDQVEIAIKLPGRTGSPSETIWLPIDAKFHREEFERIASAAEKGDPGEVQVAGQQLEERIRASAAEIAEKYVSPPHTTDFALMFLPTEGLYAEVIRRPGLVEQLQRDHRVVVAGPTTLAALLNSLQMGFRTLAVQRRSSEVWEVLGAVKTEFERFGGVMSKVQRKLHEASDFVEQAQTRTRAMERKLRDVERLPDADAKVLLGVAESLDDRHA